MHRLFSFISTLGLLGILFSCQAQMTVNFTSDETGSVSSEISILPALAGYWKDLKDLDSNLSANPLDPLVWKTSLQKQPQVDQVAVQSQGPLGLKYFFRFGSLTAWSKSLSAKTSASLFSSKPQGAHRQMTVYLDRKNLSSLLKLTMVGDSPAAQSLLPASGAATTRQDYLEALEYLLEPYEAQVRAQLEKAQVSLKLNFPRPVIQAPGGTVQGKSVTYQLGLVDLLALEKPKTFQILY